MKQQTRYRAIASTPRNGIFTIIVRAVDENDRCLYDHPRIELPADSYEHAQAVVSAYNGEWKTTLSFGE